MKRREFITLLGGAAVGWPLTAHTQQSAKIFRIGFLHVTSAEEWAPFTAAFRQGLKEGGFAEGQNLALEYRFANGQSDRLSELAADLARRQVAVIAAGGPAAVLAAKAASTKIPIVFAVGADPVKFGLVTNFNRPGGNITGFFFLVNTLTAKRLELLRELVPTATTIGFLVDPTNPNAEIETKDVLEAARTLGRSIRVASASTERDLEAAFANLVQQKVGAIVVAGDVFFLARRDQVVALAARHALPAIYHLRELAVAGGLVSYGASITEAYRQAGSYAARILKKELPGDLPVQQSTKVELVINLKTARSLGLDVPQTLQVAANEVIE